MMTFKLLILPSFLIIWVLYCSPLPPQIISVFAQVGSGRIVIGPSLPMGINVPFHSKLDRNSGSLLVDTLLGPP